LEVRKVIFVEYDKDFIKLMMNCKVWSVLLTKRIHHHSFQEISFGSVFGKFDSNMARKLMKRTIGILGIIKKSKSSFDEVVSLFGQITNISRPQTQ
jgi:hypothetical protein